MIPIPQGLALCVFAAIVLTGLVALIPIRGRRRRHYYGISDSLREHQAAEDRRGQDGPSVRGQFGHYVGKHGKGRKS